MKRFEHKKFEIVEDKVPKMSDLIETIEKKEPTTISQNSAKKGGDKIIELLKKIKNGGAVTKPINRKRGRPRKIVSFI